MLAKRSALIMLVLSLFNLSNPSYAQTEKERLIISNCMAKALKERANLLVQNDKFSMVEVTLDDTTLDALHDNRKACGKFLNLDFYYQHHSYNQNEAYQLLTQLSSPKKTVATQSYPINHEKQVMQLYSLIDSSKIWQSNLHLTNYYNRSATQRSGVRAAQWFKAQIETMARDYGRNDVSSYLVTTGKRYKQPSVVTVIGKDKKADAIVIGAHIDTLNGNMPGADDDASGISVELEIARVLLSSEIELDRPVYLIAYAAEERGLVGSSYVVESFIEKHIPVKAVMQLDQAGYRANPKDQTIWLMKDYVDPGLTQFTAELLTRYVKIPVAYTQCDYACSDHVNWHRQGFSTCYPSATTLDDDNPYLHSPEDELNKLSLEHQVNFTKLGLAFATELGLN